MKCLSLWQPWASLWVAGLKGPETRSWETSHRDDIAIHAAKKRPTEIPGLLEMFRAEWDVWSVVMRQIGCPVDEERRTIGMGGLPYGYIIGRTKLRACLRTPKVLPEMGKGFTLFDSRRLHGADPAIYNVTPTERVLGDYSPGRFAWVPEETRAIAPIFYRGAQGLFNVPDEVMATAVYL